MASSLTAGQEYQPLAPGLGLTSSDGGSAQNQQTLLIKDPQLEFGGVVGSLPQPRLSFSLPEPKVCIYFSHKRLVFNPGEGV